MTDFRRVPLFLALTAAVAAGLAAPTATRAQAAVPISTLFGTGVSDAGGLLADGMTDPHYTLNSSADAAHPGPVTSVVNETGYPIPNQWLADGPASKWIAPQALQDDSAGNGPGGDPPGTYDYRTTFDLSGMDIATALITGQWATDDLGTDILINGVSTGFTSHGTMPTYSGSGAFTPFTIDTGFVSGINTLDFLVTNGAPPGGENFNPTGLDVAMSGQADPSLVLTYTDASGTALQSGDFAGQSGSLRFEFDPGADAGAATVTLSDLIFQGDWTFGGAATFSDGVTYTGDLNDPSTLTFSIPNTEASNFFEIPVSAFGSGVTYDLAESGVLTGGSSDFLATAIDDPLVLQHLRFTPGSSTATLVGEADGASVTATNGTPAAAPEPSSVAGLSLGVLALAGLGLRTARRRMAPLPPIMGTGEEQDLLLRLPHY